MSDPTRPGDDTTPDVPRTTTPDGTATRPVTTTPDGTRPTGPETAWSAAAPATAWSAAPAGQVWSAATAPPEARPGGPRTGTMVLGLVLAICGATAVAVGLGYTIDLQLAFIGLLVVAAVTLLLVPVLQRSRRRRGARTG